PQSLAMAVVKANAYGHGYQLVIPAVLDAGATWLGVAQLDEALRIRTWLDDNNYRRPAADDDAGSPAQPRMMSWIFPPGARLEQAITADIDISASAPWAIEQAVAAGKKASRTPRIHLKVDTGLSRSGATLSQFEALVASAQQAVMADAIDVVAVWSHFSSAEDNDPHAEEKTHSQLEVFDQAYTMCIDAGINVRMRHIAASSGIIWHPQAHFDMVRAGIALYGLSPNEKRATHTALGLRPAMTLRARVITVKQVEAGAEVSYNGTWKAPTRRWLAVVPLGYADGIPRIVQGEAYVGYAGDGFPIVGRVCMDQVVIDLGEAISKGEAAGKPPLKVGDTVTLFGPGTAGEPTAVDWAQWEQTITYEVTTRLSERIPRTPALRLMGC
ncbi:MAG: alanine racemase, partial [Actinomycetaceae bacterium]|nr:alanine racemase [Actinomycetaceae bacterium]